MTCKHGSTSVVCPYCDLETMEQSMAKDKYKVVPSTSSSTAIRVIFPHELLKNGVCIALFCNKSDAQKVCDLLNETSRSQGVYPSIQCVQRLRLKKL